MSNMEVELVLTGVRAGQTILLNGHYFRRGVARIRVAPESVDPLLTYMGRAYQAYLQGSEELAIAQDRDRQAEASRRSANGIRSNLQTNPAQADGASAPVQGVGERDATGSVPDPRALHGDEHAGSETGSEGLVPGRSGHEDAGMGDRVDARENLEPGIVIDPLAPIRVALAKLDAAADEQWTDDGLPSVAVVANTVKDQTVTRAMIEAAAPGFTREQAQELAGL